MQAMREQIQKSKLDKETLQKELTSTIEENNRILQEKNQLKELVEML